MAFDPQAATAAYLAVLSPEVHAKATAYTQGGHWLLLWAWVIGIISALIVLKLRVLPKVRSRLERHRPRPLLVALVVTMVFLAIDAVITLPWTIYANWWREKSYGLSSQAFSGWFIEWLMSFVLSLIVMSLLFTAIYWLMRKSPRLWPVWAGVVTSVVFIFLMFLAPMFIEPLFNKYTPAPNGPVRSMVVQMGQKVGVPTDKIFVYNGSKQSNRYTANVSGLFGTARVAMSDTMFTKGADMAEVRGVVGHEMGHYVHKHILIFVPFMGVLIALIAFLVKWLFPRVQGWLGEERIRGVSDPAGLPILMIIGSTFFLLATPLTNSMSRWEEADADNFSMAQFNEPDGLAKALVKTIEYRAATPGALEETIFYDHPSVGWRVRNAMNFKAAHMAEQTAPVASPPPRGEVGEAR
jgi:Zn-dependent protease with chaperone function